MPAGDRGRQRARPGQNLVRQRAKRRRGHPGRRRRKPASTPEIRDTLPFGDGRVRPAERRERPFLRPDLFERIVWFGRKSESDWKGLTDGVAGHHLVEERQRRRSIASKAVRWRLTETREPRSEQTVARLQMVVEKRQRMVGCQCRKPQREARELDRHRIEIDAEEAPLGDCSPDGGVILRPEIGRMAGARANQRSFVGVRQIDACGDEKSAAAHRGIEHLQPEDCVRSSVPYQWSKCAPDQELRDWLRRVKGAGRLAAVGSRVHRRHHMGLGSRPSRGGWYLRNAGLVVQDRFVDGSQLLDPQIAIRDALATCVVDRRSSGKSQQRPARRFVVEVVALGKRGP